MKNNRTQPTPLPTVTLRYNDQVPPITTTKDRQRRAARVQALAKDNNVPLHHDTDLIGLLAQVPSGNTIPTDLYRAMSGIIAFAYELSEPTDDTKPK